MTDNLLPQGATSSTYNGWTNRETWLVYLWLGECDSADEMRDTLDNMLYHSHPDISSVLYDLLTAAMDRVNWNEIKAHMEDM